MIQSPENICPGLCPLPPDSLFMAIYRAAQDRVYCGFAGHAAMLMMQAFGKDTVIHGDMITGVSSGCQGGYLFITAANNAESKKPLSQLRRDG